MRDAQPKRFYTSVDIAIADAGGWHVTLDGRPLRTPAKALQVVPTQALAQSMADEWSGQTDTIDIAGMHLTRLANVAIDRTPSTRDALAEECARFCTTDLTCHLAPSGQALRARQDSAWRPLRDWAGKTLGVVLVPVEGIIAAPQPDASLTAARDHALNLDDFRLTGLVYGCGLFGSAVLALASEQGRVDALEAFAISTLEAEFQAEQWGKDPLAVEADAARRLEAAALGAWFEGLSPSA